MDSTYRGTITKVSGADVYVVVPKLGRGVEYGPCEKVVDVGGTNTKYIVGARVIVSTVNGIPDDLVVLGVLG